MIGFYVLSRLSNSVLKFSGSQNQGKHMDLSSLGAGMLHQKQNKKLKQINNYFSFTRVLADTFVDSLQQ